MLTLAAILYPAGFEIDAFMADCAGRLRRRGLRLAGVVQHNAGACTNDCAAMSLEELSSGRRFAISEDRGPGATGCVLDSAGLAAAAGAVAASLDGAVDLVVFNKFAKQEALGHGFRQEIAAAIEAGLPVLVPVRADLLDAWTAFAGDEWQSLAPAPESIEVWALAHCRQAA